MNTSLPFIGCFGIAMAACSSSVDDSATNDDASTLVGCRATPSEADRERLLFVQTPYDSDTLPSNRWKVLSLTTDGELVDGNRDFTMGRAPSGTMEFTPDGSMGFIAQEDGTLGVLAIDDDADFSVLHEAFDGDFYASRVVVDPSGEILWIVDPNWPENGGGIYRADIDCTTGALSDPVRIIESRNAADLLLLPNATDDDRPALLVGRGTPDASPDTEVLRIDLLNPSDIEAETSAFGDEEAIFSDATLGSDGRYALIGDYSSFSTIPNRIAVVENDDAELRAIQILPDLLDPVALIASPWDDQVLVISGYGDAYFRLKPTGDENEPYENLGEPTYLGDSPQLPTAATSIRYGSLKGRVFVTENGGIRQIRLGEGAQFTDIALMELDTSFAGIAGAIGVTP